MNIAYEGYESGKYGCGKSHLRPGERGMDEERRVHD